MASQDGAVRDRHLERIRRFVERGLRIEDHSFIKEHAHQLVRWAHGGVDITVHEDGGLTVSIDQPNHEAMESMTARIRPLILEKETANLTNVLEAVGYLVRDLTIDDDVRVGHREISKDWKARKPIKGRKLAYTCMNENGNSVTDTDLALGWLYADLVHQDIDAHRAALSFDYQDRYRAAVLVICSVAYHAKATLNLIRRLESRGLINMKIPPQPPVTFR